MKKSDRHQLSAVIHHFLYRTYELPLSWYGMTVSGLSQADITCLHGTCRTVLFAADRLMIAGDLPVLDARPFNDRVVHMFPPNGSFGLNCSTTVLLISIS